METTSGAREQCGIDDEGGYSDCGDGYRSDSRMSTDEEEVTDRNWWNMDWGERMRWKKKVEKTYVQIVRKVLREKGTPFFLISPGQFDKLSKGENGGFCAHV